MLALGIILVVVAVVGAIVGIILQTQRYFNGPFDSPEKITEVCAPYQRVIGTPAGVSCGVEVFNDKNEMTGCVKGAVNSIGNKCDAAPDHLAAGLFAGSVLVFVVGILAFFIPSEHHPEHDRKHHREHHKKRR